MEMAAHLVSEKTVGRRPRQHLLVGVARSVVGDGEVVAVDDWGSVEGLRGAKRSACMKHLKKKKKYHEVLACYLSKRCVGAGCR